MGAAGFAVLFEADDDAVAGAFDLAARGHRVVHDQAGGFDRAGAGGEGVDLVLVHRREKIGREVAHDELRVVVCMGVGGEAAGKSVVDADRFEPFQEDGVVDVVQGVEFVTADFVLVAVGEAWQACCGVLVFCQQGVGVVHCRAFGDWSG